jgi:hypothetical protein
MENQQSPDQNNPKPMTGRQMSLKLQREKDKQREEDRKRRLEENKKNPPQQ